MNKSLIVKIALGLVIVAIPVFMFLNSKKEKLEEQETSQEIYQETDEDVTGQLYGDTFEENQDSNDNNDELINDTEEDEIYQEEQNTQESENNQENEKPEESAPSKSETVNGVFQGFADDSFIEVKIGEQYDVFKVSDDVKSKAKSKNIGDSITFTYVQSGSQKLITSIN